MARRKDHSGKVIAWIILFAIASAIWTWMQETYAQVSTWAAANSGLLIGFVCAAIVVVVVRTSLAGQARIRERRERHAALLAKYGDESIVERIVDGHYWIGATAEMLQDSLGPPEQTESKVMKTKTKATWKYGRIQANQYKLRIYLDDDVVTGWDSKD